jgi:GT2 family glycosyltransferase
MNNQTQSHISSAFPFGVVILSCFPDVTRPFIDSIRATHIKMPPVVVVRDENNANYGDGINVVDGVKPFIYARNSNIGIRYFGNLDIFLCNDDLTCVEDNFFHKLYKSAYRHPQCGIMSPLIKGGVGKDVQSYHHSRILPKEVVDAEVLCFPCVLIKRQVINKIGFLDEGFVGYGYDDVDYSIRTRRAGFDLLVDRFFCIVHGNGGKKKECGVNYAVTYRKKNMDRVVSMEHFKKKYSGTAGENTKNDDSSST